MVLLIPALLILLDQVTKLWAANTFMLNGPERELGLGFYLTYTRNTGAAFGIFRNLDFNLGPLHIDGTTLLGLLSATVAAAILVYLLRERRSLGGLQRAALMLILGGAVGNMIDRFRLGYVIDFIHFQIPSFNFPVFNLADSFVVIGAGLLLISSFFFEGPTRPAETALEPAEESAQARRLADAEFFQSVDGEHREP